MRWKPGDRVVVKPLERLRLYQDYDLDIYPWYKQWCGKTVTIKAIHEDAPEEPTYYIMESDTDGHDLWIDDSFEPYPAGMRFNEAEEIPEFDSII